MPERRNEIGGKPGDTHPSAEASKDHQSAKPVGKMVKLVNHKAAWTRLIAADALGSARRAATEREHSAAVLLSGRPGWLSPLSPPCQVLPFSVDEPLEACWRRMRAATCTTCLEASHPGVDSGSAKLTESGR